LHVSIRGISDVFTLVSYLPPCPTDLYCGPLNVENVEIAKTCVAGRHLGPDHAYHTLTVSVLGQDNCESTLTAPSLHIDSAARSIWTGAATQVSLCESTLHCAVQIRRELLSLRDRRPSRCSPPRVCHHAKCRSLIAAPARWIARA
jgi:hypothetical protein